MQSRPNKNERVEIAMQILKHRRRMREVVMDDETACRTKAAIADLQQQLHEIDE
jgi:hypothetical protein